MKTKKIFVNGVEFGGKKIILIAGPCSIDNLNFLLKTALEIKKAGARMLRADAFKARTSPASFQGLGLEGLKLLKKVSIQTGLPTVSEVMDTRDVKLVARYSDMLKIGARNMQNFNLLTEVGKIDKPIFLKRGAGCKIKELLSAAKYIQKQGNNKIVLCERGIRTFEDSTRFTLDINAIPKIKELSEFPVIVDPSHATGQKKMVEPISLAGLAAGADGLLIEVHKYPDKALSDEQQTISTEDFVRLVKKIKLLVKSLGREL